MILGIFKILYNIPAAGLAAGAYWCARRGADAAVCRKGVLRYERPERARCNKWIRCKEGKQPGWFHPGGDACCPDDTRHTLCGGIPQDLWIHEIEPGPVPRKPRVPGEQGPDAVLCADGQILHDIGHDRQDHVG